MPIKTSNSYRKSTLPPAQQAYLEGLKQEGFRNALMLTLALPLRSTGYGSPGWFLKAFTKKTKWYYNEFGESMQWRMVANRGFNGSGCWSAHVIWKFHIPAHLAEFVDKWNTDFGANRAHLSHPLNRNVLAYFVKNVFQPRSEQFDGKHNKKRPEPKTVIV